MVRDRADHVEIGALGPIYPEALSQRQQAPLAVFGQPVVRLVLLLEFYQGLVGLPAQVQLVADQEQIDAGARRQVELHLERSEQQSLMINSSLILLLANHIGDREVLDEAMKTAGEMAG